MATPLVYPLMDACRIGGFGHTRCYELISAGILDARKSGSRTVITHRSLAAYIDSLPKLNSRRTVIEEDSKRPPPKRKALTAVAKARAARRHHKPLTSL